MDLFKPFQDFLTNVILPQNPEYTRWINATNAPEQLESIRISYKQSFQDTDPFEFDPDKRSEIIDNLQANLNNKVGTSFGALCSTVSGDIPAELLRIHLAEFIKNYNTTLYFSSLQDLVNIINSRLENEFCSAFQTKRIEFNGNERVASSSKVFGVARDNEWTINMGAECEIQYHLFFNQAEIGYGLAFNAQPSRNNPQPINEVRPFINSYFFNKQAISNLLPDYRYIVNDETKLSNISEDDFICLGKTIPVRASESKEGVHEVDGMAFIEMLHDLKGKQFEAYKIIFGNSKIAPEMNFSNAEYINLLRYKKQIILQGPPGTGKTKLAKEIAAELIGLHYDKETLSSQLQILQFHPSYTYEDFVRGIVAESKGDKIEYKSVNKILAKFAGDARKNLDDSKKDLSHISKEHTTEQYFERFVDHLTEKITSEGSVQLTPSVSLVDVEEDAFRYKGIEGWSTSGNRMLFKDIVQSFIDGNKVRQDIKKNKNLSRLAFQHATYFVRVLNLFQVYLADNNLRFDQLQAEKNELKNYVIIIDEINRANLSSVLGELIYALEYRGEVVQGMYEVDGSYDLLLPDNLYIIGTMNTADRSAGQIDYAIRRRFAFLDVLPKDLSPEIGKGFHKLLFEKVAAMFSHETNLSREFGAKDVQLGHSYFIDKSNAPNGVNMSTRLQYEIKPILLEYVKDGILIGENIQDLINQLEA